MPHQTTHLSSVHSGVKCNHGGSLRLAVAILCERSRLCHACTVPLLTYVHLIRFLYRISHGTHVHHDTELQRARPGQFGSITHNLPSCSDGSSATACCVDSRASGHRGHCLLHRPDLLVHQMDHVWACIRLLVLSRSSNDSDIERAILSRMCCSTVFSCCHQSSVLSAFTIAQGQACKCENEGHGTAPATLHTRFFHLITELCYLLHAY
ncbi:unnamed protein product [Dicrocoelium dendriticum]|nr:unnamed protein product [Dicrocoelium dendriticum]